MSAAEMTKTTKSAKPDRRGRNLYRSRKLSARTKPGGLAIELSLENEPNLAGAVASAIEKRLRPSKKASGPYTKKAFNEALENALREIFSQRLNNELAKFTEQYRVYLREGLAKGERPQVKAALNRARLQEKIIANTSMVDQTEACELLGLSKSNASATMKRKEDRKELLRFNVEGRPQYPLFQFDVEGRKIYPVMAKLIATKPAEWSDFRLLHWLTKPHLNFDEAPAQSLWDEMTVIAAFEREIEPTVHG